MAKDTNQTNDSHETQQATAVMPERTTPKHLPMFRVILHNDDESSFEHVIESIVELTPLQLGEALERTQEAHREGCSLLLVIHRERAELYEDQFRSKSLTVTIEPAD